MEKLLNFFMIILNKLIGSQLFIYMMGILCVILVLKMVGSLFR